MDLPGVFDNVNLDLTNSKAVYLKRDYSGRRLTGAEKIVTDEETLYLDYEDVGLTGDGKILHYQRASICQMSTWYLAAIISRKYRCQKMLCLVISIGLTCKTLRE